MRKANGFTLIELMIVVSIIGILSAIAIPNLLRSRLQANESAAISDLKTLCAAQFTFNTTRHTYGDFASLIGDDPPYLDSGWHEGRIKSGYVYTMPTVESDYFVVFADPVVHRRTGERYFRIDATGAIRASEDGQPDENAEVVGASW